MQVLLSKTSQGLVPVNETEFAKLTKVKLGKVVRADIVQMRNDKLFRKWWALAQIAFDIWAETAKTQEYKGEPVLPDFDRFRKDLTIMAGFYRPVWNLKGELRLEAESISFANMTEERFEKLYSATINVILKKIIPKGRYTEKELRDTVEQVMRFG